MNKVDPIYQELAGKLGEPNSKYLPQILAKLANLEQAKIVRELPAPSEEIAKRLGLDKALVDRHIRELFEKGLVFFTKKGPQMARTVLQLHDSALGNPKFDAQLGDDYFDLFAEFMDHEVVDKMLTIFVGGGIPTFRIIPRWKSIKDIPGVLPSEDIREIIKSHETLALLQCLCRREHRNRKCSGPIEVCINLSRTAQYNIDRGAGKKITVEEALKIIEMTDQYPMVHLSFNEAGVTHLICNCHWCCCYGLGILSRQDKYKITEGVAKSRFEAVVDPQKCGACKTCIKKCQFGAAQMKYYPEIGEERGYVDSEKCMGCGSCVVTCKNGAGSMKLVRPPEHIPQKTEGIY